jgi:UDP-glucose 4-epimerase
LLRKILVTGGAGFIGSHLVDALVAEGHDVVVVDNFCSGSTANLTQASGPVRVIRADIRDPEAWAEEVGQVDTIVHLAALISGYDSLFDPDAYDDVNIRGLMRVIEFAAERKVPRILFASSSTVYGNQEGRALTESSPVKPLTFYALTKLAGENMLRLYGELHGFSHCSLRLFNVYGPRQAVDHPYANVTCKFSHAAAAGLPISCYGDGNQSRDFVFVDDVVRAFLAVLNSSGEAIYNIGTGCSASINDLIQSLGNIRGAPLAVDQRDPWPNDIRSIEADPSLFANEFGFRPEVSLASGLERTVAFFNAQNG